MSDAQAAADKSDMGIITIKLEAAKTRVKVDQTQCKESAAHGDKLRQANVRVDRIKQQDLATEHWCKAAKDRVNQVEKLEQVTKSSTMSMAKTLVWGAN